MRLNSKVTVSAGTARPLVLGCGAAMLAAGLWSSPAMATEVELFGFLKANVESVRLSGNGRTTTDTRLVNDLSAFGFRGKERINADLETFFQIQTNVRLTGTGTSQIGDRNTGLGLRGPWGELLAGQWETPLRLVSAYAVDPFPSSSFASNSIMGNGFSTAADGVAPHSFDRRHKNLLQYTTPKWNGLSAKLGMSRDDANPNTNPKAYMGSVTYTNGNLYMAWGHETHRSYFYDGSRDHADRLAVTYKIGNTKLRGAYERLRFRPAPGKTLRRDAWQIAVTHDIGRHQLRASYIQAQNAKGNASSGLGGAGAPGSGSGAKQFSLGYGYTLSKRTEVWGGYTRLANGKNARYNLSANSLPGLIPGDTASALGVGLTHTF